MSSDAVYALYTSGTTPNGLSDLAKTALARLDRKSGAVLTAGPFPWATRVAVSGNSVWISNIPYADPSRSLAPEVIRLDGLTLAVQQRAQLPAESKPYGHGIQMSASGTSLWAAYGSHLYRLDPASGRILGSQSFSGVASSIALDPTGLRVFVGTDPTRTPWQSTVIEWDAATLQRLAAVGTGGAGFGGPGVAAGNNDVWVAFATGMLGQVEHRRASDLSALPMVQVRNTNSVSVWVVAGMVWVTDGMAATLTCLDPQTGAVRLSIENSHEGVVAGDATTIYLGDYTGLSALVPDSRCR